MTPDELKVAFARLGCRVEVVRTGHEDYMRGFIKRGQMAFGRAVIYKGELSHIKWYGGNDRDPNCPANFLQYAWLVLSQTGRILTEEQWARAWDYARQKVEEDYRAKMEWRLANPRVDRDGNPRSRKRLQKRNPRRYLVDALLEVTE